jgi:hypothetical protein
MLLSLQRSTSDGDPVRTGATGGGLLAARFPNA